MNSGTLIILAGLLAWSVLPADAGPKRAESAESLYERGMAVFKVDPEAALNLLNRAAKKGHVESMVRLGNCCETGTGSPVRMKDALQWYTRAAEAGSVPAMVRIGEILEHGERNIEPDYAGAIAWYEKGVSNQSLKACAGLARIYASCPDPAFHNATNAIRCASVLVRRQPDHPEGYDLLAAAYARNHDFVRALKVASEAVTLSSLDEAAERRVRREGYEAGQPWPPAASDAWMLEAAERDNLWAILQLAEAYADVLSDRYDPALARHWFDRAAENGNAQALLALGQMCFRGEGGEVNYDKAFWCFREAAKAGEARAYAPLARMYVGGKGAPKNLETALLWYQRSADAGLRKGDAELKALKQFGKKLGRQSPEELYEEARNIAQSQAAADGNHVNLGKKTALIFPRYWLAAEQGNTNAMKEVADMYFYGHRYFNRENKEEKNSGGIGQDYRKALEYYDQLSLRGIECPEREACAELAMQYRKEQRVRQLKMKHGPARRDGR